MTDLIDVHIYDVRSSDRAIAMAVAEHFAQQYPERMGQRNGVVYERRLYAYQTPKGRIVVRGDYND